MPSQEVETHPTIRLQEEVRAKWHAFSYHDDSLGQFETVTYPDAFLSSLKLIVKASLLCALGNALLQRLQLFLQHRVNQPLLIAGVGREDLPLFEFGCLEQHTCPFD